jgi:hypothetical protein
LILSIALFPLLLLIDKAYAAEGLTAQVYDVLGQNDSPYIPEGASPILTTNVSNIDFQWGSGGISGTPKTEDVIVRYTGSIISNTTQDISFLAEADDGTKLYLDGVLVTDDWFDKGGGGTISSPISFTAGVPKTIELMYYENGGGAWVRLSWDQSGLMQVIPAEAFTSVAAPIVKTIGPPRNLTINSEETSTVLSWEAPDTGNTQPERYAISFNADGGGWGIATGNVGDANALNTTITIDHSLLDSLLPAGTVWSFYIRSDNDTFALYSENSNVVTGSTYVAPAPEPTPDVTPEPEPTDEPVVEPIEEPTPEPGPVEEPAGPTEEEEAIRLATEAAAAQAEAEAKATADALAAAQAQAEAEIAAQTAAQAAAQAAEAARIEAETAAIIAAQAAAAKAEAERIAAEEAAEEAARIQAEIEAKAEADRIEAEIEAATIQAEIEAQEEADRIAAEVKAAEEKAEAEAKAEAERIAAEEEAARIAAEIEAAEAEAKAKAEEEAIAEVTRQAEEEAIAEAEALAEEERIVAEEEVKAEEEELKEILKDAKDGKELTEEQKEVVVVALVENLNPGESISAASIQASGVSYADLPPSTPIEVRTDENGNALVITAAVAANIELVQDPGALLTAVFADPSAALAALGSIGADMTEEEREEATDMVVVTVVATGAAMNAVAAAAGAATGGSSGTGSSGGSSSGANSPGSRGGRKW